MEHLFNIFRIILKFYIHQLLKQCLRRCNTPFLWNRLNSPIVGLEPMTCLSKARISNSYRFTLVNHLVKQLFKVEQGVSEISGMFSHTSWNGDNQAEVWHWCVHYTLHNLHITFYTSHYTYHTLRITLYVSH